MSRLYRPTPQDVARIKEAAAIEAVPHIAMGAVLLEPGLRSGPREGRSMNPLLVSDDPDWNDTDLDDYGLWSDFRKGVELTEDGRGVVDFYIRRRFDEYQDLHGNVTIDIRDGQLVRVCGTSRVYFDADAVDRPGSMRPRGG